MNMNKFENAPDEVTIKEAADILEIPADWVVAKIDSGLPAHIYQDTSLVRLSSLIPCGVDSATSLQTYYLDTRIPRTDMKPQFLYCQFTLADEPNVVEENYTDFDAIRILKVDLLKPVKQAAKVTTKIPPQLDRTGSKCPFTKMMEKSRTGLQIITEEGKKFLTGTEKAGAYRTIKGKGKTVYLVEGWADACKVHNLTGATCIVCFDCGNLLEVGKAIRTLAPNYDMVFVADNDRFVKERNEDGTFTLRPATTEENKGVFKATTAALATGARLAIPTFSGADLEYTYE